ncbi:MAG: two-component system, sensor histidine kinase and response regulator, partial [Microbacteriaceae bacterium]|nr:two-component system, sensor histidine kinase and response regulator [Microbacteriaceae bacterium]
MAGKSEPTTFIGMRERALRVWMVGAGVYAALVLAGVFALGLGTPEAQSFGDFAVLLPAVIASVGCFRVWRRRGPDARAWLFMGVATGVWGSCQALWSVLGLILDHRYPFPSLADAGFIGYSIPAAIALFLFHRSGASKVALLRTVLDAAVIASATLFVSWATVLGALYRTESQSTLGRLTTLGYPIVDVVITSLVLVLAMRRVPGQRRSWLMMGAGLLVLTISDSVFVRLTLDGIIGLDGTPLAVGWVLAFLLIGLAALTPQDARSGTGGRGYTVGLELLPYVPVVLAIIALFVFHDHDPFLVFSGLIVLALVIVRQVLIVYENVTLTRELEQKVAKRTAELEGLAAIVNSSADAILGTDKQGFITNWNPGAEKLYGYSAEGAIGRHHSLLRRGEFGDAELAGLKKLIATDAPVSYQTERVRKDGSIVPVAMTVSPIFGDGGTRGVAAIAQDITERLEAEAALSRAREEALESSRLKSEFLATMSHEIRTPMNGVIGLTTLLLDTPLDQTQRQYAEGVKGAGEVLLTLINDILDLSKLEAGKVELENAPFDPRNLVEEVAALLSESARVKGLELIAYCSPGVPAALVGDYGRIRQVLVNLVSNAVKFTAVGEVAIRVDVLDIDGDQVRFEVRDTGIGIDESDHERLFDSFSQADASTTRRYGGTGLGLAISRRLTQAMGGEIGLTSRPGQGSTFWFVLPLAAASERPPHMNGNTKTNTNRNAIVESDVSRAGLAGQHVLIVDDNATNRLVLESQLGSWKMIPESEADGASALRAAREADAAGRPFDIAVLDMSMPGMDGLQLARTMSADENLRSIALIMLTSKPEMDPAELAVAGVRQWLMKPVRSSELFERLVLLGVTAPPASAAPVQAVQRKLAFPSRGLVLVVEDNAVNQLVAREMVTKLGFRVELATNGAEAVAAVESTSYQVVLMDCHMPVMDGFDATAAIRGLAG